MNQPPSTHLFELVELPFNQVIELPLRNAISEYHYVVGVGGILCWGYKVRNKILECCQKGTVVCSLLPMAQPYYLAFILHTMPETRQPRIGWLESLTIAMRDCPTVIKKKLRLYSNRGDASPYTPKQVVWAISSFAQHLETQVENLQQHNHHGRACVSGNYTCLPPKRTGPRMHKPTQELATAPKLPMPSMFVEDLLPQSLLPNVKINVVTPAVVL